jgi:ankyrin repeat protein
MTMFKNENLNFNNKLTILNMTILRFIGKRLYNTIYINYILEIDEYSPYKTYFNHLNQACQDENIKLIKLLMKRYNSYMQLKIVNIHYYFPIAKEYVNQMNYMYNVLLNIACKYGKQKTIDYIIKTSYKKWKIINNNNAIITKTDKAEINWDLAFEYSCIGGHMEIVKLMIKNGAKNLEKGFYKVCKYGHIDIVKTFIEKKDLYNKQTALWYVNEGHTDNTNSIIELLSK